MDFRRTKYELVSLSITHLSTPPSTKLIAEARVLNVGPRSLCPIELRYSISTNFGSLLDRSFDTDEWLGLPEVCSALFVKMKCQRVLCEFRIIPSYAVTVLSETDLWDPYNHNMWLSLEHFKLSWFCRSRVMSFIRCFCFVSIQWLFYESSQVINNRDRITDIWARNNGVALRWVFRDRSNLTHLPAQMQTLYGPINRDNIVKLFTVLLFQIMANHVFTVCTSKSSGRLNGRYRILRGVGPGSWDSQCWEDTFWIIIIELAIQTRVGTWAIDWFSCGAHSV